MQTIPEVMYAMGTVVSYNPDAILYMEHDLSRALYVLLDGAVRTYRYDAKGHEIILPLPGIMDLLGELPVNEGDVPLYRESCEVETPSRLLRLNSTRLCRMAHEEIAVANFLLAAIARRSRALTQYTGITTASSLSEKVARFIYEHEALFVSSPLIRIGAMLNIPPESLSRILRQFRQEGILAKKDRHYLVEDRNMLRIHFDFAFFGS